MRALPLCLLATLALTGCPKKEPTSTGDPKTETKPVARPAPVVAAPAAKIDCEKLIPPSIRNKYFASATMKQEPMCPGCPEHCKLTGAKPPPATVIVDCRGGETPQWMERAAAMWEKSGYKKTSGAGRAAYSNAMQFIFVPEKHNCHITVTWFGGGEKLAELAKDIDKNLTPAAIGK